MSICPYCGEQVADGAVCTCQYRRQPPQYDQYDPQYSQYGAQPPQYGQYDPQYSQYGAQPPQYSQYDPQYDQYAAQPPQYGQYDPHYSPYGAQPPQYGPYVQPSQIIGVQKQLLPGKTMLRVVGILLIISGVGGLGIVLNNFDEQHYRTLDIFIGGGFGVFGYFELIANIALAAVGIMATAMAAKKSTAGLLLICGIVLIALIVADALWLIIGLGSYLPEYLEDNAAQFFVNVISGLVLPVLLVVGASIRKKAKI